VSSASVQLDSSEETCKLDTFLEMSSGEKTVSEGAKLSTSVKPMDDLPKSKSGASQTKLNKTDLPTSGDSGHVARWVADLEQHLPMDVESASSSKKRHDSYTVRSYASRSSTTSKKYRDSVVKARLAAKELNVKRAGAEPDIFIWGATGGASFATRGAVNGLCRTFRKRPEKFGGATVGARQNFGGAVAPPGTPLAPPLRKGA